MKFREFLSLTDEEIEFIVHDIFNTEKIENIRRDEEWKEITCDITTEGWNDGEEGNFSVTDELTLKMPTLTNCGIQIDFSIDGDDMRKWRQFCLAKGCNDYLKDNQYL